MTYREKLQQFIVELDLAHDKAGAMRDHSFDQDVFNNVRRQLTYVITVLSRHDNSLTEGQAKRDY